MLVPRQPDFEVRLPADPDPPMNDGDSPEIDDDPIDLQVLHTSPIPSAHAVFEGSVTAVMYQ
jgi:hypothetical protein